MRGSKPVAEPVTQVVSLPLGTRLPAPPNTLPEGLPRECWAEVVRELVSRGTWDSDIKDVVEAYCVHRARFITANAQVEEGGLMNKFKRVKNGKVTTITKPNPYVAISNAAYDRMMRIAQELGLTAVRRGSVTRSNSGAKAAGAEKFLKSTKPAKVKEPV